MTTVEEWTKRVEEIDNAIVNATHNVYVLQGHKAEASHHLSEAKKAVESLETQVEQTVQ